jgi:hypothetical protein
MGVKIERRLNYLKGRIMSSELLHELFSGLEKSVHERLVMAEDVLHKKQESELAELIRVQGYKIDAISLQLSRMAEQLAQMKTPPSLLPSAMATMMTATAPAPAPVPVSLNTVKNVMVSPPVLAKPVLLPEPEVVEEEVDDAEVEEEVEEEEVEEEAMELEEFTYKGKTYYKDGENQVYQIGSDGELDDTPVGIWNEKTKRIHPI